jgi:N-acyl-D-aspartate/D-glutamate deacylase
MLARLALPETRARIRAEIERDGLNNWGRIPSWDNVQISISPNLPQHAGETFGALATARNSDPVDAVCDYLIQDKAATRVLITSIAEDDIRAIVRSPTALVGSDGNSSPITASPARACRTRASTAPSRAFWVITCMTSSCCPSKPRCTR